MDNDFESMYNMLDANIIGSLIYAIVCTKPNIPQAIGVLSMFMSNHSRGHLKLCEKGVQIFDSDFELLYLLSLNSYE